MIKGIKEREIIKHIDERGFFSEIIRKDWLELLEDDDIIQFNLSFSYPKIIRAWHRHSKGQVDFFICVDGTIKVCVYDDREESETYREIDEIVLSSEKLKVVRIPGSLWHGYMVIGYKPAKLLYGVNNLYDYEQPDEDRRPWNDTGIVPITINGKKDDPRVGKPWDWSYPPHK
jgi:dTDP-4-dehydrorhamnose 3,5-epimerase